MTLVAFGVVLMLGATDAIDLDFSVVLPVACAAVGAILLSLGLSRDS